MRDLIDREAALACFHDWVDHRGDVHAADEMIEYQHIEALPTVDAVPVPPEIRAEIRDIIAMYEYAKDQQWIKDPVAWSLYQVWKDCGGREDGDDDQKE